MSRLSFALLAVTAWACPPPRAPASTEALVIDAGPPLVDAGVDAGVAQLSDAELQQALALNCQACHSLAYVEQQRMTEPQWVATLTKMRGWGAQLEEGELGPLARALASRRGPKSPLRKHPQAELTAFVPGPGDEPSREAPVIAAGKQVFEARCVACHGADARGGIGVNLGDRPWLQQPARFADFVHSGRGRMPPHPDLDAAQLDSVRAYLGTL